MGFTLIFEGLFLMLSGMMFTGFDLFYLPTYLLYALMMLLSPVLYYFALRFSLRENGVRARDLWILEAVAVYMLICLTVITKIPSAERNAFFDVMRGAAPVLSDQGTGVSVMLALDDAGFLFFMAEQLFVQIFCFVNLSRYNRLLETYHSNLNERSTEDMTTVFVLIALRFVIYVIEMLSPSLSGAGWFHLVRSVAFIIFYVVIVWKVCRVHYTAEELSKLIAVQENRQQAPVAGDIIGSRLEKLIEEKFYIDPDIDLMSLASRIQVNSKYVAEYIRRTYGETFLFFVNRLRVEHAISLMEGGKLTLLDVAEQSGYVSQSTFYRNFTKIKGVSPSNWKKK